MTPPSGPAPDRAAELAEAETIVRSTEQEYQDAADAIVVVMAEYDRRGRVEAAARALMEGWGEPPRVERDLRWCSPQLDQRLDALARELGGGTDGGGEPRCGVGFPMGPMVRGMYVCCLDRDRDGPHRSQVQMERAGGSDGN